MQSYNTPGRLAYLTSPQAYESILDTIACDPLPQFLVKRDYANPRMVMVAHPGITEEKARFLLSKDKTNYKVAWSNHQKLRMKWLQRHPEMACIVEDIKKEIRFLRHSQVPKSYRDLYMFPEQRADERRRLCMIRALQQILRCFGGDGKFLV